MRNITAKSIESHRADDRKPADASPAATAPQFSPKRPRSHHGLLRGPYYPLANTRPVVPAAP